MARRALVLGSGGVTGVAWEAGVLCALAAVGLGPEVWDVVVGTSAGAFVGAWFRSGHVAELEARQTDEPAAVAERNLKAATGSLAVDALRLGRRPGLGWLPHAWTTTAGLAAVGRYGLVHGPGSVRAVGTTLRARRAGAGVTADDVRRLGGVTLAAATATGAGGDRWVSYLGRELGPVSAWPDGLVVTTLHLGTGTRRTFDAAGPTSVVRAVAASTAVPLVVGPVTIDGEPHGDGGSATPTNADLAAGHDEVLVVAPVDRGALRVEVAALRAAGSRVTVLRPGHAPPVLGRGVTTMDPHRRASSARAGRADAARVLTALARP